MKVLCFLSKWILAGKNVSIFMCEISLKGGEPFLKIEITYVESK